MSVAVGTAGASESAKAATPKITYVVDSSWNAQQKATLQEEVKPEGTIQKTETEVIGAPKESITVTVTKSESGEYVPWNDTIDLPVNEKGVPRLSVLLHEEKHATDDQHILRCSTFEEAEARATEQEAMRLLSLKGITEEGYDLHHAYGYDVYHENDNQPAIGASECNIFAEQAMTLERYEQYGYSISKIMMENPAFLKQFDVKLFEKPDGNLSPLEVTQIAEEVQPVVEGQPMAQWINAQHFFNVNQPEGGYLSMRVNQYTVDAYCVSSTGEVNMVPSAKVGLAITGTTGKVYKGKEITSGYGWATFSPEVPPSTGRLMLVATAAICGYHAKSTFYRQSGAEEGVFGVIVGATSGTVTLSSPNGQFATFSEPVVNGAFVAPSLESIRGEVIVEFTGEGKMARIQAGKDAAPYGLVMKVEKIKKTKTPKETTAA